MSSPEPKQELRPFREQEPFLESEKKYYGYISGVGAGKTYAGVLRVALNMEHWNPGEMGAIVAPTTTMIKDVIIPLMRETGLLDHWDYKSAHTDEPGIHSPNGSRALILSADNARTVERLAGLNLAWWWLDEGSRTSKRAREILEQRLRVGNYRNGFVTTTPMGKDHVYEFFVGNYPDGIEKTHGEGEIYETQDRLAILYVPTWANPFTAEDYKEQMRAKEGQTYEREILGRFVDYEGLVYPWFDLNNHIITPEEHDRSIRQYIYGVDWGHNNPSVILAIGVTGDGDLIVRDEFYESRHTVNDLVGVLQGFYDTYGHGRVFCDPAEPASIETLQRAGIDATGAVNDILPGIQQVTAERDRLVVAEHCRSLIDEFGMYRYPDGDRGGEKPVDANNHALDALRYALLSFAQSRVDVGDVAVHFG